jgi:tetratricopeptide (TPR) repeat protein
MLTMPMAHTPLITVSLLPVLLLRILLPAPASAAEPSPWLEVHSTHFTIITDAGDKKGREVALRFEQMRAVFSNLLTKDRLNQPVPLTILAFKNDKSYYQLAPLRSGQPIDVPGFFLPGEDQDFIVLNLFEDEPWRAVAHDFAHMLLDYNYPPAQEWFDEGLAEYFSSIRVDNRKVEIGGDPELRPSASENLLQSQVDARPPKSLTELLGDKVWLSIPDLFSMRYDASSYREGSHHTMFYAESWMVMHYLINQKKLPETGGYFDLVLNQHVPVDEAIQKAYGMTPAQFEQAVRDYFHSQTALSTAVDATRQNNPNAPAASAQPYHFPVPVGPDDVTINSNPLPEADARAICAGIEVRIPERREAGLKDLEALATTPTSVQSRKSAEKKADDQSLTLATGNEIAHRALAWDHIEHGEFNEAASELSDAASLNQSDLWIRYYLSVLKYRMAEARHADIQGLANMMQDLRAVLDWYPEFADAYDLMGVARMEGGGATAAMQAERAAMQLSPRNELYMFHQAQIYIAAKQWPAAQALLDRLKASGNPQIVAQAREKLEQVGTERKYGIPVASQQASPKLAPQKSPFDVLEQDAAQRAAASQTAGTQQEDGAASRRPAKFLKGRLISVDCSHDPVALLTVVAASGTLKLRAPDYKSLIVIGADEFSCDWQNRQVTVNYRPGGASDGDLISLELR